MLVAKTEMGQRVMKDRSVALTPRQRSAFILFDGKHSLEQVLQATTPMGVSQEDIEKLFELGLIKQPEPAATPAPQLASRGHRTAQERYADAYPVAIRLTASLGLRGFRLNLAVEAATNYEELLQVAPKIREAVSPEDFRALKDALNDL